MSNTSPDAQAGSPSRVAVVIPFYQRSPGLLTRALASIFGQDHVPLPQVVVVDDASPVPAADEVDALAPGLRQLVTVIRQVNAGPGQARNTGLDHLGTPGAEVDYVAFLDSDDEWLPGHLARAVAALDAGHDIYFSNYRDIGASEGGFEARGRLDVSRHPRLPGHADVHRFDGSLCEAILTMCPLETSTVVYRRAVAADLRFRPEFRLAYEDLMFWYELAAASDRAVFSAAVGTQYGTGVNIYRGVDPGSDAGLRVCLGSTLFGARVRSGFDLSPAQAAAVRERLDRNRRAIAAHLLHRLRRRQAFPRGVLSRYLAADPASWLLLPWHVAGQAWAWLTGRRGPDQEGPGHDR